MVKFFFILNVFLSFSGAIFSQVNESDSFTKLKFCGYKFRDTGLLRKQYQQQLNFLQLKDGDTVVDVGTGSGSFIGALNVIAEIKQAHFILVDIDSNCLTPYKVNDMIRYYELLHGTKFNNTFSMVLNNSDSLYLPLNKFRKILLLNTLHEIDDKFKMAKQLAAVLQPGGDLIIGEMSPMGKNITHQGCHKPLMSIDEITGLFARFGFKPTGIENVQPVVKEKVKHPYNFIRLTKM